MKTLVLLLTLALLAIPSAAGNAGKQQDDDESPVSFRGTWQTIGNGNNPITVVLKQIGKQVTGSYSSGNGKIFDGEVSGRKLTFKWTQDGGYEGTAEFTMDKDGKSFTGSSTALKPEQYTVTWNSYVSSFGGNWQTISDGKNSIFLTMVQNGPKVTGIYPSNNGKLEGTVSGKVLRFKWESESGSGSGRFVMDEGGFSGTYNSGDNPDDVEATWNGTHLGYSGGKTSGGKASGSGTSSAVSFAGEWILKWNATPNPLTFRQVGEQVNGFCSTKIGDYDVKEGTVVGRTLRFKLFRASEKIGVFEGQIVMDEGGKSFKGNIQGQIVTGTFVRP